MLPRIDRVLFVASLLSLSPAASRADTESLRVCAQSDNFPLSDRRGQGFENKLAELTAAKLGRGLVYTWWPARENFLDRTLKQGKCDVVMDVPAGLDEVETTRPYYRGTYVFVSRTGEHLSLSNVRDPRLKHLQIGVYLIGDEQTPPALALSELGINDNVHGFMTFFDRSDIDQSQLISAVSKGNLDVAAAWGPLVGYYVRRSAVPLTMEAISGSFGTLPFQYDIAMGVRRGDDHLKQALDKVIGDNSAAIRKLLQNYGVFSSAERAATPVAVSTAVRRRQ